MKTFERFDNTQFKFADVAKFIFLFVFFVGQSAYAQTFRYPVLGRLTEKNGKPVDGPVTLQVNFYRTETGGATLLSMTANNVPLQEGIFQLSLDLTPNDYNLVFSSVTDLVYVEITDVTHDPSAPYPRMLVGMTAYAGKVPVDSKTTYFNSSGQLAVGPNASPSAGQFLTKDGSGNFVWATPSGINSGDTSIGSIALGAQQTLGLGGLTSTQETTLGAGLGGGDKGKTWFNTTTNQLKYWDGSSAVAVGASGAGLTNFNGQSGLTQSLATSTAAGTAPAWSSASNVHTLQIPMASAATVTAGLLSKTDYDSFVAKLDKTGGTMTGSINLGGNDLRNMANVILGTGDSTGTPVAGTFMGPSGLGTDISGTDLTFDASKGTGSSGSGGFIFRTTASGGASGTTANTLAAAMTLTNAGYLGIGTTSPTEVLHVSRSVANETGGLKLENKYLGGYGNSIRFYSTQNFGANTTIEAGRIQLAGEANYLSGAASSSYMHFDVVNAGTLSERMRISSLGNIGIGTTSATAVLHLKAGTATAETAPLKLTLGTNLTTPEAGAIEYDGSNLFYTNASAQRLTLATTSGAMSALAVTDNATVGGTLGVTGAATFSGGASVAANQNLSMSSGTGTFTQTYTGTTTGAQTITADSVTTASVESISANGLTSGNILNLTSTSTAAAAGNTGLNIGISGANATSSITRYGMKSSVTATGTTSTNVGGYFTASGAANNYGLIVDSGNVGIGTTTPTSLFTVNQAANATDSTQSTHGIALYNQGVAALTLGSDASYNYLQSWAIKPLKINSQGNNTLINPTSGSVGIGTTSPGAKLSVGSGGNISMDADTMIGFQGSTTNPTTSNMALYGNTGITILNTPASGTISFRVNNSAKMTMDSSGNVGIGTTSPARPLHVTGSGGIAVSDVASATANISIAGNGNTVGSTSFDLQQDSNYAYVWNRDNTPIILGTNETERMRIDNAGNVGIGTTSPLSKFEVSAGDMRVSSTVPLLWLVDTTAADTGFFTYANAAKFNIASSTDAGAKTADLLSIDRTSGNVGIGTTAPGTALHVSGVTPALTVEGTGAYSNIVLSNSGGSTKSGAIVQNSNGEMSLYSDVHIFTNAAGSTEKVRITSAGNVGIGTTAPAHKLHVFGGTARIDSTAASSSVITYGENGTNKWDVGNTTGTDAFSFYKYTGGNGSVMTLLNSGNVGVGTTAPTATLDINSDTVRLRTAKTPASATAACNQGDIVWDANYVYICVSTNTWKRSAIATW